MIGPRKASLPAEVLAKLAEMQERIDAGAAGAVPTKISQLTDDLGLAKASDLRSVEQMAEASVKPSDLESHISAIEQQIQAIQLTPGPAGKDGKDGADGESIKGDQGEKGLDGKDGRDGLSPTISMGSVSVDAVPSATLVDGKLNLVLAKAKDGEKGADGGRGPTGVSPVLSIGSVSTGPAAANLTGTPENPVLNLSLPSGPAGKDGSNAALPARYAKLHTTTADGTLTINFPAGRFTSAPVPTAAAIVNDPGYVYRAQILTCSATQLTLRITRSQIANVNIVLGGLVKLNESLTSAVQVSVKAEVSSD